MMKLDFKSMILGILISVLILTPVAVFAETVVKSLTAEYTDIKVRVDGSLIILKNANGGTVEPFAVDGTTYLPMRSIVNAFGYQAEWQNETNTILLNKTTPLYTVTPKGKKYHFPDCRSLANTAEDDQTTLTLQEVLEHGYEACSVCSPPKK